MNAAFILSVIGWHGLILLFLSVFSAQPGGGQTAAPGTAAAAATSAAAAGGGSAGGQQDYSAAWAEYYRQQAAYYGQPGQAPGQAAAPQPGQQVPPAYWTLQLLMCQNWEFRNIWYFLNWFCVFKYLNY